MASSFHLKRGETLLGVLNVYGGDMPWLFCKFKPSAAFEEFRPLFEREMELGGVEEEFDADEVERLSHQIASLGLHLIFLENGKSIHDFMLHIQGDEAWFTTDWLAC